MYYCDVERDYLQADGDEPAGDRATSHDRVHDVHVNMKIMRALSVLEAEQSPPSALLMTLMA